MKKTTGTALLSLLALTLTATPSLQAAERFKDGQWEINLTVDGRTQAHTYCITPVEAKSKGINEGGAVSRDYLEKGAAKRHCTIKDFKFEGNTLSYTQACSSYTFSDRTTYSGDSFEGVLTTIRDGHAPAITHTKGRRLGACP
jgi:hypothetical protein